MGRFERALQGIRDAAPALEQSGAVLSGEAAAHAHLMAATGTTPDGAILYAALAPRRLTAIYPDGAGRVPGIEPDDGPVAEVIRASLDRFGATAILGDGTRVPVLSRDAVVAELLSRGGLALGLAGTLIRVCDQPAVDPDDIREILKAARQGERFQPLLELLSVA